MSPKQQQILKALRQYMREHGEAPTLTQLGEMVSVHSKGTMHRHISHMVAAGLVKKTPRHWRGIKPTQRLDRELWATLPIAGKIAAGRPIEAIEDYDEVDPGRFLCGPDRYVLKLVGDSMQGIGLLDGDYVVIEQQDYAHNGQVVVAIINHDEATLKRYFLEADGKARLEPENSNYPVMVYPAEQVAIQGILVGQMRSYG